MKAEVLRMILEVLVRECQESRQMAAHLLSQNERRLEVLMDLLRGKINTLRDDKPKKPSKK